MGVPRLVRRDDVGQQRSGRLRRIQRNVQYPSAHRATRGYVFLLKDGPGPIQYRVNPDGTVPYTGASFSSRNATWRDPNLRNPYIMNWSAGFQFQPAPTWLATATYQGTAGVGLVRSWNINQIPLSIALGNDRALQDKVFASQQNYLIYPQFGTINYLSNFNHNTWHSGNFAIEKRYASGLTLNATLQLVEVAEQ